MANDVTSNPWRLDTAPFSYPTLLKVKIVNLNITDATAADHVVITDNNGKTIVDFTANASELDYRIGNIGYVNGIKIGAGGLGAGGTAVVTIAIGAGK